MTGWRPLAETSIRLAHKPGARIRRRPCTDRPLYETVGEEPTDRVRGTLAAAYALSGEICEACGRPGDPVRTATGRRTTRSAHCPEPGDDILPRPPCRRKRGPDEDRDAAVFQDLMGPRDYAAPVVEDIVGTEDLAALMEARYTPATHVGWPVTAVGGYDTDLPTSTVEHAGSNHLTRAALSVLLPLACPAVEPRWRLSQLKEKMGLLTLHHVYWTDFYAGSRELLRHTSAQVCIKCGRPGRLRNRQAQDPREDQAPRQVGPPPSGLLLPQDAERVAGPLPPQSGNGGGNVLEHLQGRDHDQLPGLDLSGHHRLQSTSRTSKCDSVESILGSFESSRASTSLSLRRSRNWSRTPTMRMQRKFLSP